MFKAVGRLLQRGKNSKERNSRFILDVYDLDDVSNQIENISNDQKLEINTTFDVFLQIMKDRQPIGIELNTHNLIINISVPDCDIPLGALILTKFPIQVDRRDNRAYFNLSGSVPGENQAQLVQLLRSRVNTFDLKISYSQGAYITCSECTNEVDIQVMHNGEKAVGALKRLKFFSLITPDVLVSSISSSMVPISSVISVMTPFWSHCKVKLHLTRPDSYSLSSMLSLLLRVKPSFTHLFSANIEFYSLWPLIDTCCKEFLVFDNDIDAHQWRSLFLQLTRHLYINWSDEQERIIFGLGLESPLLASIHRYFNFIKHR